MPRSNKKMTKKLSTSHIMLKMVLLQLYLLPLDIKNKIYKMCVDRHMVEWMKEHMKKLKPTISYIKKVDYVKFTEIDYIPVRPGFLGRLEYFDYKEGEFNPFLNSKITRPCHLKYVNKNPRYLNETKTDVFVLNKDIIENKCPGVLDQISTREFSNSLGEYWVGKKCRCLKCDLVRLMFYNGCTKGYRADEEISRRYCRITYDPFEKNWKTETKSQQKAKKDALRKQHRENMKRAKEISLQSV